MHLDLERGRAAAPPTHRAGASAAESSGTRAVRLLRHLPLFEGALAEGGEGPFADSTVGSAAAGTVLFDAGEPAAMLYVVVYGRVRLMLGRGASARVLAVMGRGDTIGLAALLRGDLYPVTAIVAEDALMVGLPASAVQRMMAEHPAVAARLVGDMGAKLARFVRDIGGFTQRSARARVARMLAELHRSSGTDDTEIAFHEPKRAIASRLAMTPETLSRELHALAAQGLIESRRTRFRVLDADGLARAAEDGAMPAGAA
jgi:CRP-like cAMP-binding protein